MEKSPPLKQLGILQILKDAGYRLVRDDSPERGRERERTVDVKKREKREPVGWTQCSFTGRPCELKYIIMTRVIGQYS
jgi:hypothetical protein